MMRMADRIVVIDQGSAVESGSYDELLARNGKFAELLSGGLWLGENGDDINNSREPLGVNNGRPVTSDLPLRNIDASDSNYYATTPKWVGLRDTQWADRGPSTGISSPLASPFGASRRKERQDEGSWD
ncbi:hypothetical protein PC116_g32067 [Phytophthora cactorum]|nr:hypothetical protein PC116_g32067 [Phytophthora cactorum]